MKIIRLYYSHLTWRELFFKVSSFGGLAFDKWFNDFLGIGIPSFSGESECAFDEFTAFEYHLIAILADFAMAGTS
jgi:hypothetical protein